LERKIETMMPGRHLPQKNQSIKAQKPINSMKETIN